MVFSQNLCGCDCLSRCSSRTARRDGYIISYMYCITTRSIAPTAAPADAAAASLSALQVAKAPRRTVRSTTATLFQRGVGDVGNGHEEGRREKKGSRRTARRQQWVAEEGEEEDWEEDKVGEKEEDKVGEKEEEGKA